MRIANWIHELLGACRQAPPSPSSRRYRDELFPSLFVRQLEQRRVLSIAPVDWSDAYSETTFDAGDDADDGVADVFQVSRDGDDVRVSVNGDEVYSARLSDAPNLTFNGSGDNDTLILDFSGGDPRPAGGITFHAMGESQLGGDTLVIEQGGSSGTIGTLTHTLQRIGDGFIQTSSTTSGAAMDLSSVAYTGVESVDDGMRVDNRVFAFSSEADTITLTGDAESDDSALTIDSTGGASIRFASPLDSLSIHGGVDDSITISGDIDLGSGDLTAGAGSINVEATIVSDAAEVRLDAGDGALTMSGAIDVSSDTTGGVVYLLGDQVQLSGAAQVNASGTAGGGSINIGGGYQGSDSTLRNASYTYIGADVVLRADATLAGDGGTVIVWADKTTQFLGAISARGGSLAGDGGFAEISGKYVLTHQGSVDLSAQHGATGTLLLDPLNIEIIGGLGDGHDDTDGSNVLLINDVGGGSNTAGTIDYADIGTGAPVTFEIRESEIEEQSKTAHIVLRARNSIFVSGTFNYDGDGGGAVDPGTNVLLINGGNNLTLETQNDAADGVGGIDLTGVAGLKIITTGAGTITIETGTGGENGAAPIALLAVASGTGAITVTSFGTVSLSDNITTEGGDVLITGATTLAADVAIDTTLAGGAGNVTFANAVNADLEANDRTLTITAGGGDVDMQADVGGTQDLFLFEVVSAVTVSVTNVTTQANNGVDSIDITATTLVTLGGNLATDGGGVGVATGNIDLNTLAVELSADVTLDTNDGGAAADGTIELGGVTNDLSSNPGNDFGLTMDVGSNALDVSALTLTDLDHVKAIGTTVTLGATTVDDGSGNGGNAIEVVATTINLTGNLTTNSQNSATGTGAVLLTGAVVLQGLIAVNTENSHGAQAGGDVTFTGAVNADLEANDRTLQITTGDAVVDMQADVGGTQDLFLFEVVSSDTVSVTNVTTQANNGVDSIDITATTLVTLGGNLATDGGGVGVATGNIDINALAVEITADVTLNTNDGGAAADGTIDLSGVTNDLSSNPANDFGLTMDVGANALDVSALTLTDLDHLKATGTTVTLGATTVDDGSGNAGNAIEVVGATINLTGNLTTNSQNSATGTGAVLLTGAVVLQNNIAVNTENSHGAQAGGDVTFTGAVNADTEANDRTLQITTGDAVVDMQADVGGTQDLFLFEVISADTVSVTNVTTQANNGVDSIDITATTLVTIGGDLATDGGGAGVATGNILVDTAAVTLTTNVTLDTNDDGAAAGGDVTVTGAVNADAEANNRTLQIDAGDGAVDMQADVGGTQDLFLFEVVSADTVSVTNVTTQANNGADAIDITATTLVTLGGDLATDGGGVGVATGNIDINALAVEITADVTLNTNDGGAGADGTIDLSGVTNDLSSNPANDFGLTMDVGANALDVSALTLTDLDHLKATGTTVTLGATTVDDGSGNGDVAIDILATTINLTGNLTTNSQNSAVATGAVLLAGAVVLQNNIAVNTENSHGAQAGGDVTFTGAVNADTEANNRTLQITTGDASVDMQADVGGTQDLFLFEVVSADAVSVTNVTTQANNGVDSIDITATTTVTLGGNLATDGGGAGVATGNILVDTAAVTLTTNVTLDTNDDGAAADGDVTVTGTVNADVEANNRTLQIDAGGGAVDMQADIGGTQDLFLFEVVSADTVSVTNVTTQANNGVDAIDITATTLVTLDGDLATNGGGVGVATGNIDLNTLAVELSADVTLDTNDGGAGGDGTIDFTGVTNDLSSNPANDFGLTMDVGSNALDVSALTLTDLDHLKATGTTVTLGATTVDDGSGNGGNAIEVVATTINLTGNLTTNSQNSATGTGAVLLTGAVVLQSNIAVNTENSNGAQAGGDVTFTGAVNADTEANNRTLQITTGDAVVDMQADVGGTQDLFLFEVVSADTVSVTNVTTQANSGVDSIDITATTLVTLGGSLATDGGGVGVATGNILVDTAAVTLAANVTLDTNDGGAAADGDVTVTGTVDAAANNLSLTIDAGVGAVDMQADIGAPTALRQFQVVSASTVNVDNVTTQGNNGVDAIDITATGLVTLGGALATNGGGVGVATGNIDINALAVELSDDVTLNTNDGGAAADGTIDLSGVTNGLSSAPPNSFGLTMDVGANALDVSALTLMNLDHVEASGTTVTMGPTSVDDGSGNAGNAIEVTATTINLTGNLTTNSQDGAAGTGAVLLTGAVVLQGAIVINTENTNAAQNDGAVTINGTVDADAAGGNRSLTIDANDGTNAAGDATILGDIGVGEALDGGLTIDAAVVQTAAITTDTGNVDIDSTASVLIGGAINTIGNGSGVGGAVTIDAGATVTLAAAANVQNVTVNAAAIRVSSITSSTDGTAGAITLNATAAAGNAITFTGDMDTTNGGTSNAGQLLLTTGGGRLWLDNPGGSVAFRTDGVANDQHITIGVDLDANGNTGLVLSSGTANVNINAAMGVGAGGGLGLLDIDARNINFNANVVATSITGDAPNGLINILSGTLESSTGKVTHVQPPTLALVDLTPGPMLTDTNTTQTIQGTFGQAPMLGENFTVTVNWNGAAYPALSGVNESDELATSAGSIVVAAPSGSPGQLTFGHAYNWANIRTLGQVEATVTISNDANIVLNDGSANDLNSTTGTVTTLVLTQNWQPVEKTVVFEKPASFVAPPTTVVWLDRTTTPLPPARMEDSVRSAEAGRETASVLTLVRIIEINGVEEEQIVGTFSDELNNILEMLPGLFDWFLEAGLPNGRYRIYIQEPNDQPRILREFTKSENAIGEQLEEPGRGSNPIEKGSSGSTPDKGDPTPQETAPDQSAVEYGRLDLAWERWAPRGSVATANVVADDGTTDTASKNPNNSAKAVESPADSGDKLTDAHGEHAIPRSVRPTRWANAATLLTGAALACHSTRGCWEKRTDKVMEESENGFFGKVARLRRHLRR